MKLTQNPWEEWGFIANPFNTRALSANSKKLNICQAFVGRSMKENESKELLNTIRNPGGGCVIIEGDIGVGKTTLVNYHRYLWENVAEDRLLSTTKEIPVYSNWEAKHFLIEILGHLTHRLIKIFQNKKSSPINLLKKLQTFNQIFYQESVEMQGNVMGIGLGYSKQSLVNTPNISESQLIFYIEELLIEVKKIGYKGIILHFDNLELLNLQEIEKCQYLFEQIRDILQIPDIYYIFVCRKGFFSQVISPCERVRSIMGWPIYVPPLTCSQVIEAINVRYQLLSMKGKKQIYPVTSDFIEKLYNIYSGKIRFIMDSIAQIGIHRCDNVYTLNDQEAEQTLIEIVKLKTNRLSSKEYECLKFVINLKDEFTNDLVASAMGMQKQNVSKIMKKLRHENLIYYSKRENRSIYYSVIEPLKILISNKKRDSKRLSLKIQKRIEVLQNFLQSNTKITSQNYRELTNVSANTARSDIKILINSGVLKKQGKKKGTYYIKVED